MVTLSNTTAKADATLPKNILEVFQTVATKSVDLDKNRTKLVDLLRGAGIPYTHLLSPNGGRTSLTTCPSQKFWDDMVDSVILGFTPAIQKIMASPPASLTQAQKEDKKLYRQKAGSIIGKISGLLKKNPEKGPRVVLTGNAKASNDMQLLVDKVRNYKDMDHDIVQQVDTLLALSRTLGLDVK